MKHNIWRTTRPLLKNKENVIPQFISDYYYSFITKPIIGKSLVATTTIFAGEWILEYIGDVYVANNFRGDVKFNFRVSEYNIDINATYHYNYARYINHSCDPNCETVVKIWNNEPHLVIAAIRTIYTFEEITISYGFKNSNPNNFDNSEVCLCGSTNCIDKK